jgi:hypothetical protein
MRRQFNRRALLALGSLLLFPFSMRAQQLSQPFPRDGATKVQDNDFFSAWDVILEKGKPAGTYKLELDQVSVSLTEGAIKLTMPDGTWEIQQERLGSIRYDPKRTTIQEECISDTPCHLVVFQLKDYVADPWPTRKGIPGQFPRINTLKLFETDRITVWDQVWKPGERVVLHTHYHRTGAVFLQGGTLQAYPDSNIKTPPFTRTPGQVLAAVKYSPEAHVEEQVSGSPRAIWIEFTK